MNRIVFGMVALALTCVAAVSNGYEPLQKCKMPVKKCDSGFHLVEGTPATGIVKIIGSKGLKYEITGELGAACGAWEVVNPGFYKSGEPIAIKATYNGSQPSGFLYIGVPMMWRSPGMNMASTVALLAYNPGTDNVCVAN